MKMSSEINNMDFFKLTLSSDLAARYASGLGGEKAQTEYKNDDTMQKLLSGYSKKKEGYEKDGKDDDNDKMTLGQYIETLDEKDREEYLKYFGAELGANKKLQDKTGAENDPAQRITFRKDEKSGELTSLHIDDTPRGKEAKGFTHLDLYELPDGSKTITGKSTTDAADPKKEQSIAAKVTEATPKYISKEEADKILADDNASPADVELAKKSIGFLAEKRIAQQQSAVMDEQTKLQKQQAELAKKGETMDQTLAEGSVIGWLVRKVAPSEAQKKNNEYEAKMAPARAREERETKRTEAEAEDQTELKAAIEQGTNGKAGFFSRLIGRSDEDVQAAGRKRADRLTTEAKKRKEENDIARKADETEATEEAATEARRLAEQKAKEDAEAKAKATAERKANIDQNSTGKKALASAPDLSPDASTGEPAVDLGEATEDAIRTGHVDWGKLGKKTPAAPTTPPVATTEPTTMKPGDIATERAALRSKPNKSLEEQTRLRLLGEEESRREQETKKAAAVPPSAPANPAVTPTPANLYSLSYEDARKGIQNSDGTTTQFTGNENDFIEEQRRRNAKG